MRTSSPISGSWSTTSRSCSLRAARLFGPAPACGALFRAGVLLALLACGCGRDAAVEPVDLPPVILSFSADKAAAAAGEPIVFSLDAADDVGLDSAVVVYGDSARTFLALRGRERLSATVARYYAAAGTYDATLTVFDTQKHSASRTLTIHVTSP